MGMRGRETRHRESGLTFTPPSRKARPALWTPPGTGWLDGRPPGRRPFRDPRRSRELGRPWWICLRGRDPSPRLYSWSHTTPLPKKYLGALTGLNGGSGALPGLNGGPGALPGLNWGIRSPSWAEQRQSTTASLLPPQTKKSQSPGPHHVHLLQRHHWEHSD